MEVIANVKTAGILRIGSLVWITSYGPYFGCTGVVCRVDVIEETDLDLLPFYQVELHDGQAGEPVWFERDAVVEVEGDHAPGVSQRQEA
jgi:hypothetical protein